MCEFWGYNCGHIWKKACGLPKKPEELANDKILSAPSKNLVPYDLQAQNRIASAKELRDSKTCPGMPAQAKQANSPCYNCIQNTTTDQMYQNRPQIEALKMKRQGAGNDNWGFSSRNMNGLGPNANKSWMDEYQRNEGGYGTYCGTGRFMTDKRTARPNQDQPMSNAAMPPGGAQSWPWGRAGMYSATGSQGSIGSGSSGGGGPRQNVPGYGSGGTESGNRSKGSSFSGTNISFNNPFARAGSDGGFVGAGLGNGIYGIQGGYGSHLQQQQQQFDEARGRFHSV